jgi:hypothetical protein
VQLPVGLKSAYGDGMTKLFEQAIESVRRLPPDAQDEIGRLVLHLAGDEAPPPIQLTPAEDASFDESFAQAERGEFAPEQEMRAIWAKHGL